MRALCCAALLALALVTPAAAPAKPTTLVAFHKTGGIAGIDQRLTVRSDGLATLKGRTGAATRRHLRAATMRRLRSRLAAAHLERGLPSTPSGCADCYVYAIASHGHRVKLVDAGNLPSRMRPLVAELNRIASGGR